MPGSTVPAFHHQASSGVDANRCAWFALRHFSDEDSSWEQFKTMASTYYVQAIGIGYAMAEELVDGGNDPAPLAKAIPDAAKGEVLPSSGTPTFDRILIALKNRAHFITIRRVNGVWRNYDSLLASPQVIANVGSFLEDNPGSFYYWK